MTRMLRIISLVCISLASATAMAAIQGSVFDDANGNGQRDAGEKGIAGAAVSDQEHVVLTDAEGRYELPDAAHVTVFVTMPSDYEAPRHPEYGVPQFFRNIHAADRGLFKATVPPPATLDFPLQKRPGAGDKARMIVFSDPQVYSADVLSYYRADAINELMGQKADFVITLGDITGDAPGLLDDMAAATAALGIPVFGVIGNHDRNYEAENPDESPADFKRVYGPDWYSFDRGKTHFVALNTVYFLGKGSGYDSGLNDKQLRWLKADLEKTPADRMVCLMMHIPMGKEADDEKQHGFDELKSLLKDRQAPILAIAGHWHTNSAWQMTEKEGWTGKAVFHHYVVPTVCGGWWGGPDDYRGVPYADQSDGTPNGYTIWDFDGVSYKARFKPSNFSDHFQARIYTPDMNDSALTSQSILANIFFAPAAAAVEMSVDNGAWKLMERVRMKDPWVRSIYDTPYARRASWMDVRRSQHIWRGDTGELKSGPHAARIRTPMLDGSVLEQGSTFVKR
ncbi:MAG: calcineurin-like phosphoesterase family protein [bacterium]|nr:calcineurin-like phosphoesterase family protein [Candidatus Sumerlaeota bacterium]